jgi:NTE family protein
MDIALALGGGGVKGIAHIGVIDRLESHGFRIRAIAGTSAGGLVGASYAAGNSPLEILNALQNMDPSYLYRRRPEDGPSLLGEAGLVSCLSSLLEKKAFSDLRIPFACTAVDINSEREVYLKEGPVLTAALATMAVPGILPPVQIGSATLVDGGVLDPVPVQLARELAPGLPIIAVVLNPAAEDWGKSPTETQALTRSPFPIPTQILQGFARMRFGQAFHIFSRSIDINSRMIAELRLKIDRPDVIIRPEVFQFGLFDRVDPLDLVEAGRSATEACLSEILVSVSWRGKINRLFQKITPINAPTVIQPGGIGAVEDSDQVSI